MKSPDITRPNWLCTNVLRQIPFARPADLKSKLEHYIDENPGLTFVQIGAHRGGDLLAQHWTNGKITGILVEPQKDIFEGLHRNYGHYQNLDFENVAIMDFSGERTMFKAAEAAKGWETTLASFDRSLVEKQMNQKWFRKRKEKNPGSPASTSTIFEEKVRCLTMSELLAKRGWNDLDLLFIDAEGADGDIILSLALENLRIRFIYFESMHLSFPHLLRVARFLKKHGFALYCSGEDTVAILGNSIAAK